MRLITTTLFIIVALYGALGFILSLKKKKYKLVSNDAFFNGFLAVFFSSLIFVSIYETLIIVTGIMTLLLIIDKCIFVNYLDSYTPSKSDLVSIYRVLVVALIVKLLIIDFTYIPSSSMRPTLKAYSMVLLKKFGFFELPFVHNNLFSLGSIKRGDIISFRHSEMDEVFIKRVIAIPGDTVVYDNNKDVYVNNKIIAKQKLEFNYTYIDEDTGEKISSPEYLTAMGYKVLISESSDWIYPKYINSNDCKLTESALICLLTKDNYFVMGDNRDYSFDSRYIGFIPKNKIVGVKINF